MAHTNIELANLIQTVADQLRSARDNANKGDPIIDLAECELELAVEVTTGGKGGIKVWVVELGGERTKVNTNTVRVKFTPHNKNVPVAFVSEIVGEGPKLGRNRAK